MRTLSQLSESFEWLSWMTVVLLVGWMIYRLYSIWIRKRKRFWIWNVKKQYFPKLLKLATALTSVAALLSAPTVLLVFSPSGRLIPPLTTSALLFSILLAGLLELALCSTISERLMRFGWKKGLAGLMLIPLALIWFPFFFAMPDFLADPPREEAYLMDLPIEGTWAAGHAGVSPRVNYHSAYPSQKYAIDIVKVDEQGCFFEGKGNEWEDFFTFRAQIFAPVGGRVVQAVEHLPNHPISHTPSDSLNPAGNHVVIEFEKGRYVFLAHFHPGSVGVSMGDTVEAGQFIGLAGNSGNSSWPHLHMHIQDRPDIDSEARAYPFYFRQFHHKRWLSWNISENEFLLRNDLFRPLD